MLYTLTDIEAQIAPATYERGWRWFTEGRVTAPGIQRGGEIITAVIPQPGGRPLRVYVLVHERNNTPIIDGECTCATRHNCEHVVASLLQALEDQQALIDGREGTLRPREHPEDKAFDPMAHNPSTPSQVLLLYLLHVEEQGVLVEPKVADRLHPDGYAIGRRFEPGNASRRTPARFLQPVDLELLGALDRLPRTLSSVLPILNGEASDQLLRALLATGRCHLGILDDVVTPLRLGPARPIAFDWRIDDAAYQRIIARTTPAADLLPYLINPWYLDIAARTCGPVETPLTSASLHVVASLPPVAPDQVVEVSKALAEAYPGVPIPSLQAFAIETAQPVRPIPCLCLTTEETTDRGENSVPDDHARLRFDYGGIEVDLDGPDTRLIDTRVVRVPRSRKAEQAAAQRLRNLGFEEKQHRDPNTYAGHFTPASRLAVSEPEPWLDFQIKHLPGLREQGWRITYHNFRHRLCEASRWTCHIQPAPEHDWFSIELGVEVDGRRVDLLPILLDALRQFPGGLPVDGEIAVDGLIVPLDTEDEAPRLLHVPVDRILPLLQALLEMYDHSTLEAPGRLPVSRVQLARLAALDAVAREDQTPSLQWLGDDDARHLLERLRNLDGIEETAPPPGLRAELRPYQRLGLNWLQFLREYRFAGILADDMGLGKTLQALAHLLLEKDSGRADRPSLVVAPTSLMSNWRLEARRFAPQLKVLVLQGPQRKDHFATIADHDLVITTYPLLTRDRQALLTQPYHLLILDEAQVIKNPQAQASRVVRSIDARHRLCLTGTPMENHLGELWALFDFLLPGLLGDSTHFRRYFRTPIEQHGNNTVAQHLSRRIRPFLLRRTKAQVAAELPEKTEIVQSVALQGEQREFYETVRLAMHHRVRDEIARQGLARSHIVVLDALLKLRQVCCDPRLIDSEQARLVGSSAKLDALMQLLPEMVEEGRRVLLFSQFTTMLGLIEDQVRAANIDYVKLTGQTRDRQTPVQSFQRGAVPLFLISLKAGGVGLNLTAADTVIHYDPWWNPAVERQATDRAHRIGQRHAVFVYKLICEGTVEEKIQAMQQRKQGLADSLYHNGGNQQPSWSTEDLDELFGVSRDAQP